jgi:hypothetical protein
VTSRRDEEFRGTKWIKDKTGLFKKNSLLEVRNFSLLQTIQTCPGAHPVTCSMDIGLFSGVKRSGHDDHSPQSSAEFKNEWSYTAILGPPSTFMAWIETNFRFLTI